MRTEHEYVKTRNVQHAAQNTEVWKYTDGDKHYNAVEDEEMEQADCKNQWRQVTLKRYCVLYCDAVRMSFRH